MTSTAPQSVRRAIFVADAHLDRDDEHARAFILFAERAAAEGFALFLLGDIFDLWFGAPALTFGFQRPVVEALRSLRRDGLRLFYAEGNRDFHLKRAYEGDLFEAVAEERMEIEAGGKRLYLSHGDTVNRADLAYRFWKALSKNPVSFHAATRLPPSFVLPLADRVEKRLRPTNPRFKGRFPEAEIVEFARGAFRRGIDVVVLGHFHTEYLRVFGEGGGRKVLATLPAWKEGRRHLYLLEDGSYGIRPFRAGAPLA